MTIRSSFLGSGLLVLTLAGCGGGSTSTTPSASGSATISAPAPTSSAPSPSSTSAQPPAASGDFCEVTAKVLDSAKAYVHASATPDHAKFAAAATAERKVALASAPSEIAEDVRITVALAGNAQAGIEGTPDELDIPPQTPERIKAAAGAWKTWTEKNCSADIAARWSPKPSG